MFHQIKIVMNFINPFERKAIVTNALINVTPQYDEGGGGVGSYPREIDSDSLPLVRELTCMHCPRFGVTSQLLQGLT